MPTHKNVHTRAFLCFPRLLMTLARLVKISDQFVGTLIRLEGN